MPGLSWDMRDLFPCPGSNLGPPGSPSRDICLIQDCCIWWEMLPVPKAGQVRITMASQVALVVKRVKVKGAQSCLTLCDPVDSTVQFSPGAQSCPTLCYSMNRSMPGLPVHHKFPEFIQIHVHRVGDAIQPSHPLSSPSPPAPNPSQHQGLFQWVSSPHEMAKVLEFQLQHQSFQGPPRTDLL